jgi:hypothetical protein
LVYITTMFQSGVNLVPIFERIMNDIALVLDIAALLYSFKKKLNYSEFPDRLPKQGYFVLKRIPHIGPQTLS